ncbi:MAG: AMP-binding protein [Firmicutes bacterium]|nr:AMP-binding protein [Bacillota bacterium]
MNKRKYKDSYYEPREIGDLRELITSSAGLFGTQTAFLVKDEHSEPFRPITFSQLMMDINALGTQFVKMGLKDKKIAVIGENSYEWVVTYFATTCGCGVVVPIDRELHPKEVANLMERAGVSALVHSSKLREKAEEALGILDMEVEYVVDMGISEDEEGKLSFPQLIQKGKEALAEGNREYLDAEINPDEMCALLFTSGTTGMAKGVMLSHTNLTANVYNMSKYVNVEGGVGLSVLPMHHSYEMTCHILTGLYQGIAIAICEGLKYIQSNLAEVKASVLLGVPLIFENMHKRLMRQAKAQGKLETMEKAIAYSRKFKLYNRPAIVKRMFKDVHNALGGNITHLIAGGAAINPKVIEDFEAMGFPMFQGYGMTENSPILAVNRDRYSKAASAGTAMPGTEIRIDDPDESGMGEVIARGPSVMLGYYDNEEATAENIVDGWLMTGDYGYLDEEGYLYITGRKKSVIVTKNGKNVFPEEIEFYLTESDYIEEALVHEEETKAGEDTVIKAEIYPNFNAIYSELEREVELDEVKDFISGIIDEINDEMPPYKRIKRFGVRKTEFVKTTTRKIKRYVPENLESEKED